MQLKAKSAMYFARNVERQLFDGDEDRNESLESRAAQDKDMCSPTLRVVPFHDNCEDTRKYGYGDHQSF
ncbi:hypothetical protein OESDEN_09773 [Oesophagostomum dentatum]|uniref:Uncharacterized protein n=1 Tax=Oesophagostomum dentatum TaxID=61180 RepID=A0A0B1T4Q0_OESDE|nr:hypothetical protein OESDEN_09773 [Oesophagostomum dentatum]